MTQTFKQSASSRHSSQLNLFYEFFLACPPQDSQPWRSHRPAFPTALCKQNLFTTLSTESPACARYCLEARSIRPCGPAWSSADTHRSDSVLLHKEGRMEGEVPSTAQRVRGGQGGSFLLEAIPKLPLHCSPGWSPCSHCLGADSSIPKEEIFWEKLGITWHLYYASVTSEVKWLV